MGIVQVLTSYADKYGVALVNSSGHFTEYGKDLMEAANQEGAALIISTNESSTTTHLSAASQPINSAGFKKEEDEVCFIRRPLSMFS